MQIVIDISEKIYNKIKNEDYTEISDANIYSAIKEGEILPEEHGKLIDADDLNRFFVKCFNHIYLVPVVYAKDIDNALTIVKEKRCGS